MEQSYTVTKIFEIENRLNRAEIELATIKSVIIELVDKVKPLIGVVTVTPEEPPAETLDEKVIQFIKKNPVGKYKSKGKWYSAINSMLKDESGLYTQKARAEMISKHTGGVVGTINCHLSIYNKRKGG